MRPNEYPRTDTPAEDDVLLIDSDIAGTRSISIGQVKGTVIPNPLPTSMGGTGSDSVDTSPVNGSTNMITSGGVFNALKNGGGLSGVIPPSKGGTGNSSVDTTPTSGSTKMVTSGGLFRAFYGSPTTEPVFKLGAYDGKNAIRDISKIVYGNDVFVAINGLEYGQGYIYVPYSINGRDWIYNFINFTGYGKSLTFVNGRFFLLTSNGSNLVTYTSTNGTTWTQAILSGNITDYPYDICYGNGRYVAVSNQNKAMYSTNGTTWTVTQMMPTTYNSYRFNRVAYGNGKYIALRNGGMTVLYSTNATTWNSTNSLSITGSSLTNQYTTGIAYGNGMFVISAYGNTTGYVYGALFYSSDGATWTRALTTSNTASLVKQGGIEGVSYVNGKFVTGSVNDTFIYTSTDGINWSMTVPPTNAAGTSETYLQLQSGCYGNGITVMLPNTVDQNVRPIYSTSTQPV